MEKTEKWMMKMKKKTDLSICLTVLDHYNVHLYNQFQYDESKREVVFFLFILFLHAIEPNIVFIFSLHNSRSTPRRSCTVHVHCVLD